MSFESNYTNITAIADIETLYQPVFNRNINDVAKDVYQGIVLQYY